jgi:hypothetical protein
MIFAEQMELSGIVRPWNYAFRSVGIALVAWSILIVILWIAIGGGCILFLLPFVLVIAVPLHFAFNLGNAARCAKLARSITIEEKSISIKGGHVQWDGPVSEVRYFRGWTNDELRFLTDARYPALLISWPPHSDQSRCIGAVDSIAIDRLSSTLRTMGALEQPDRKPHSRLRDECISLLPGAGFAGLMILTLQLLSTILDIAPLHWFSAPASAGLIAWMLSIKWLGHYRGDLVVYDACAWAQSFIRPIVLGALGTKRAHLAAGRVLSWDIVCVSGIVVVINVCTILVAFTVMARRDRALGRLDRSM